MWWRFTLTALEMTTLEFLISVKSERLTLFFTLYCDFGGFHIGLVSGGGVWGSILALGSKSVERSVERLRLIGQTPTLSPIKIPAHQPVLPAVDNRQFQIWSNLTIDIDILTLLFLLLKIEAACFCFVYEIIRFRSSTRESHQQWPSDHRRA